MIENTISFRITEEEKNTIQNIWFKNHEAILFQYSPTRERLLWKNINSGIYSVDYVRYINTLFVTGDIGSAVYRWSNIKNMQWLSTLSLEYFESKCEASEKGKEYTQWNPEKILAFLKKNYNREYSIMLQLKIKEYIYSRESFNYWIENYGYNIMLEWSGICNIGETIHIRCIGHWLGLKMAFEQLNSKE